MENNLVLAGYVNTSNLRDVATGINCGIFHGFDDPDRPIDANIPLYTAADTMPAGVNPLLEAFDAAVLEEISRVSELQYNSRKICEHFAAELRVRMEGKL